MNAEKKLAFVTGGSRGIGLAITNHFRSDGTNVIAPIREELDLSDLGSVSNYLMANTELQPEVVVINAGENHPKEITDLSYSRWERTLNVNLNSAFLLIQEFSRRMAESKGGRIVVISSCYSLRARTGRAAYSVSKAALNALVRSVAVEFAPKVLINAVAPGFVLTELTRQNNDEAGIVRLESQIPLGRLAEPVEIAELVNFLCSEKNTYMTGQVIPIDGGFLCQ
jgi:NAD(P)-dependent dehydrogenase (short-subunit alcohol dehydrogenase family)